MRYILLLGSYDDDTLNIMNYLKERLNQEFLDQDIRVFLLSDLELFTVKTDKDNFVVLVERKAIGVSVYLFRNINLDDPIDAYDINDTNDSEEAIKEVFNRIRYKVKEVKKYDLILKFWNLAKSSLGNFVIREKEETRCGEVVELTLLAFICGGAYSFDQQSFISSIASSQSNSDCIHIFKKHNIQLSSMIKALADRFKITIEDYQDQNDLYNKIKTQIMERLRII